MQNTPLRNVRATAFACSIHLGIQEFASISWCFLVPSRSQNRAPAQAGFCPPRSYSLGGILRNEGKQSWAVYRTNEDQEN